MNKYLSNQQGVTLVELMVAITIFAIGLLAIAGMQITSMRTNISSTLRTEAVALGQSRMEALLARATDDPLFIGVEKTDISQVDLPNGGNYTITALVTPGAPLTDLATIRVQVQITGGSGKILSSFQAYKRLL